MYFGRKHRDTLLAVRERTGDPTAQPTAEELAADQMVLQEVLRRICVDSGACVVIVDQIGAKGKEDREENEIGRVLPLTTSGLEYFVDVMLEASLRLDGLDTVRIFRVVKSNSAAFPIGLELRDPNFAALLARLTDGASGSVSLPVHEPAPATAPETLEDGPTLTLVQPTGPTLDDLLAKAGDLGFSRAQLVIAARHYCGKDDLERLTDDEVVELDRRLTAHASRRQETADAPEPERNEAATAGRGRRGQG
jgi:hypothetical protein